MFLFPIHPQNTIHKIHSNFFTYSQKAKHRNCTMGDAHTTDDSRTMDDGSRQSPIIASAATAATAATTLDGGPDFDAGPSPPSGILGAYAMGTGGSLLLGTTDPAFLANRAG